MVCVWFMEALLLLFLYTDLHKIKAAEIKAAEDIQNYTTSTNYGSIKQATGREEEEYTIQRHEGSINGGDGMAQTDSDKNNSPKLTWRLLYTGKTFASK